MAVNRSCCSQDRLGRPTWDLAVSISSPGPFGAWAVWWDLGEGVCVSSAPTA